MSVREQVDQKDKCGVKGARQRQNTGNVTAAERPLLQEAGDAATRGWMTVGLDLKLGGDTQW